MYRFYGKQPVTDGSSQDKLHPFPSWGWHSGSQMLVVGWMWMLEPSLVVDDGALSGGTCG